MRYRVTLERTETRRTAIEINADDAYQAREMADFVSENIDFSDAKAYWNGTEVIGVKGLDDCSNLTKHPPRTEAAEARWRAKGFTEPCVFEGEYILLTNPKTRDRVRIYFDGDVFIKHPETGVYEKEVIS